MIPTFRQWTHTSDDSYIYQLSLVVATATVSFFRFSEWRIPEMMPFCGYFREKCRYLADDFESLMMCSQHRSAAMI